MEETKVIKDPVCGMERPKNQFSYTFVYKGKTYYFCSEMDRKMFEKYPDRWIGGEKG